MRLSASIVSRRRALAGAGAAVTCLSLPLGAEETANLAADGFQVLHARAGSVRSPNGAPDGTSQRQIWGFQGAAPGPLLRAKHGRRSARAALERVARRRRDPLPSPARPFQIVANGAPAPDLAVRANERLRLRLINAAQARVVVLRLDRHAAIVMAIDGQPSEPFRPRDNRVILGPGNTADLFVDATLAPGAAAPILWADAIGETPLARLVYDPAPPVRAMPLAAPRPLPANPLPARLDLIHAVKLDLALDGLARGTAHLEPARFKAKRGRSVMLALANRQEFACAVHVHGHAFRLLDRLDDGWKPFWLATVVVDARQMARIAFLADNPGKWLIECVGIGHPETARAGWFEVA
jgi:FtsP/CotA-like multicopper oxidase with cupredoxin domain